MALNDRYRWLVFFAAIFISLARVFVGIHYVGDIFGGIVVAAIATLVVHYAYRPGLRMNDLLLRLP